MGTGFQVIDAVRPPAARGSLLAWVPARCARPVLPDQDHQHPRTVHHGGAQPASPWFRRWGRLLARWEEAGGVREPERGPSPGSAQPALADTRTGALRLMPGARIQIGAPAAWARWLPDGRHLVAGGLEESHLVDASAMIARPLFFIHDPDHYIEDSQDLNYSAVIVPPRR